MPKKSLGWFAQRLIRSLSIHRTHVQNSLEVFVHRQVAGSGRRSEACAVKCCKGRALVQNPGHEALSVWFWFLTQINPLVAIAWSRDHCEVDRMLESASLIVCTLKKFDGSRHETVWVWFEAIVSVVTCPLGLSCWWVQGFYRTLSILLIDNRTMLIEY